MPRILLLKKPLSCNSRKEKADFPQKSISRDSEALHSFIIF